MSRAGMVTAVCATLVCSAATAAPAPTLSDYPVNSAAKAAPRDFVAREVMIPMRDGVMLKTMIYEPMASIGPRAILLTRTPYSDTEKFPRAANRLANALGAGDAPFIEAGFIRAYQDIRGRGGSGGEFIFYRPQVGEENPGPTDESTDAWDTIDWLVRNVPDNNGAVGVIGASWRGYTALTALVGAHPALKAVVPINPVVDRWKGDDDFDDGAFRMIELCFFETTMRNRQGSSALMPGQDLYETLLPLGSAAEAARALGMDDLPYWRRLIAHPAYDAFWQGRSLEPLLAAQVQPVPTLLVAGLFDADDRWGAFRAYEALRRAYPPADAPYLAIGPWSHAQSGKDGSRTGPLSWGEDTSATFYERQLMPFLREHLQGILPTHAPPRVLIFDTGNRSWREQPTWNSASPRRTLFLDHDAKLSASAPSQAGGKTAYPSDPANPVPTRVRPILGKCGDPNWRDWLTDDQRGTAGRADVVSWSMPVETALPILGSPVFEFYASTSGSDADWIVKVIDKAPALQGEGGVAPGYELLLANHVIRARYRDDHTLAKPAPPNAVVRYRMTLPPVAHTLQPGHQLVLRVQSSSFPLYDRNPQTFTPNILTAPRSAYVASRHTIFHSAAWPSRLELPIGPK